MCGIAGIIAKENLGNHRLDDFIESSQLMRHRGPDFKDYYRFENVLLIHYRLSIIDLDERSNQPFKSQSETNICVYNGEIYNYKDLISGLKNQLKTKSDTEVMLESFEQYGKKIIPQCNGIFSICILDEKKRKLHLIRDRFGVKPLYYYEDEQVIAFASEAKVLFDWLPGLALSPKGIAEYLWYGNTISDETIVSRVRKFEPGTVLEIDLQNFKKNEEKFWSIKGTSKENFKEKEVVANIKELLTKAVRRQLVSDVPLGILLSGGIDSSAIVALASQHSSSKFDTYSVEYDYNIGGESELKRAALVAKKYNTNHHEMMITSENVPEIFQSLVYQYDEPFGDTASIPLHQLAKACSIDKTVILQGDGGDEIFAGYRRYNIMDWLQFWKVASKFSYPLLKNDRMKERMKRMSFILNQRNNGLRMAYFLTQNVPYISPYNIISEEFKSQLTAFNPFEIYEKSNLKFADEDLVQRLLYADTEILLPNTYLEKVDKATMLASIEARVPFLDNDLTDYVLGIPAKMKVKRGQKKYLLRKALKGLVPDEILNGRKRGFEVPYKKWLRSSLYDFAHSTFSAKNHDSIMDSKTLLRLLEEHKQGKIDHGPILWKALILVEWINIYKYKLRSA